MKFDQITENRAYHYGYTRLNKTWTGKGEVIEKLPDKAGGPRLVLHDKARNKTLTLPPASITKAARVR